MTIEAKIIADSVSKAGKRITTFVLKYPRFVHAELMTHRMLSRNASSSRAIPVEKIIQQVLDDPAMPVSWGSKKPGMQAGAELSEEDKRIAITYWLMGRNRAVDVALAMVDLGVHKQIANRVLEPWHHITVVATATEWNNLFALRCHKDAQPEFQALAMEMAKAYNSNSPIELNYSEWHLPFVLPIEVQMIGIEGAIKCSVARCARVSYQNHDGSKPDIEKDFNLHDRLIAGSPKHASPAEHQARPYANTELRSGNFIGWGQYRKTLKGENITEFPWEYFLETQPK